MRGIAAPLGTALAVAVIACGDDSSEKAAGTKTITSEFPAALERGGYFEAITPGTGGFIETPQRRGRERVDELGKAVPEVKRTPGSGTALFTGVHRDVYLETRAACRKVSRRRLARQVGVTRRNPLAIAGGYALRFPEPLWEAAFEGCAVGIATR